MDAPIGVVMMASDTVTAQLTQRDRAAGEAFVEAHYRSLYRWFLVCFR
jgi:hypothetical protein